MFPGCTVPHDSKETELESSEQEACPSSGKYARLVPFRPWKCVPPVVSRGVDISEVRVCHLSQQMGSR